MINRTTRRPGVTLMEVLIATGILAVGMLAIMALFPIGAVSMARAINQNRAADHAANSDAMFRYHWKKAWIDSNGNIRPLRRPPTDVTSPNGTYALDVDPYLINYLDTYAFAPNAHIPTTSNSPGYVVFVDPIGWRTQTGNSKQYVCGSQTFPARSTFTIADPVLGDPLPRTSVRLTTLQDDMSWDINGEPSALGGQLDRGGRYTSAWLIQRPKNSVPHEVRLFVFVYGGRSPTDTPSLETPYWSTVSGYFQQIDPKPSTVTMTGVQSMPNLRRGSWVAVSLFQVSGGTSIQTLDMYRVAGVTDNIATSQQVVLELEQPLKSYYVGTAQNDPFCTITGYDFNNNGSFGCYVVVFENLLEVFDRGIVSAQAITGR